MPPKQAPSAPDELAPDEVPTEVQQADSADARYAAETPSPVMPPAAETVPDPGDSERYRVVGPHAVFGVEPGELVKPDVTREQLLALLGGGHIVLETTGPKPDQNKE